jgi:serine/threonine-protein kinase
MKLLNIHPGMEADARLTTFKGLRPMPLDEIDTMLLQNPLGKLTRGTRLRGRFHITATRAYGRITEAILEGGGTYTVCLEVLDSDGRPGFKRAPAYESPKTVMVYPNGYVRAVERFPPGDGK